MASVKRLFIPAMACLAIALPVTVSAKTSPSTAAYKQAMKTMHHEMMVEPTGDVDTDFARGMIPHHQGAIDMAKIELKYGKDEEIRKFAEWVISIQTQEIASMKHWLTRKGAPAGKRVSWYKEGAVAKSEAAMHRMHENMAIHYTGDPDIDFVQGMIPHHQGAVDMADIELTYGRDFEMNRLATGIVTSQNGEIARMQRWLDKKQLKALNHPKKVTSKPQPKPAAPVLKHDHMHMHQD